MLEKTGVKCSEWPSCRKRFVFVTPESNRGSAIGCQWTHVRPDADGADDLFHTWSVVFSSSFSVVVAVTHITSKSNPVIEMAIGATSNHMSVPGHKGAAVKMHS